MEKSATMQKGYKVFKKAYKPIFKKKKKKEEKYMQLSLF
jgi:hypothetical protein